MFRKYLKHFLLLLLTSNAYTMDEIMYDRQSEKESNTTLQPVTEEKVIEFDLSVPTKITSLKEDLSKAKEQRYTISLWLINATDMNIKDLRPFLDPVNALDLSNCYELTNIDVFADLYNLKTLDISNTHIKDICVLATCLNLQTLSLNGTKVIDLDALAHLPMLHTLDLACTPIKDGRVLSKLSNLHTLDLSASDITDFSFVPQITNLHTLSLRVTKVTDFSFLARIPNLKILDLSNNNLTDLNCLPAMLNLHTLDLGDNDLTDLNCLPAMPNLHTLDLSKNSVVDMSLLTHKTPKLHTLIMSRPEDGVVHLPKLFDLTIILQQ